MLWLKVDPPPLATTHHAAIVTTVTVTVPPTRAKHLSHTDIGVAIAIPIACLLGLALFTVTVFIFVYWRGYLKYKKSVNVGQYGVKRSNDPDLAPFMDNA